MELILNPLFSRETIHVRAGGVGPHGPLIQQAMDALAARGGGTVCLASGTYHLEDSLMLRNDVRLQGEDGAILCRDPKVAVSALRCDVDVGQYEFTPEQTGLFRPGMGICFHDRERGWSHQSDPLTVTAVRDGKVFLNRMNLLDRLAENGAIAVHHFPLVRGRDIDRAAVENLILDGQVEDRQEIATLSVAGLYLYHSRLCLLRRVTSRNMRGDGICFGKASIHTVVDECHTHHNHNYGIHPGSHSAHCLVRGCHIHDNASDGLYICWGIHHSRFEENDIHDNGRGQWRSGISIGHKDTDNHIARNRIYHNAKYGICVRVKTAANGAHRNHFEDNLIENNGHDPANIPPRYHSLPAEEMIGCGVHINGITDGLRFTRNTIRETRAEGARWQRHAFVLHEGVTNLILQDNQIDLHPDEDIVDPAGVMDLS